LDRTTQHGSWKRKQQVLNVCGFYRFSVKNMGCCNNPRVASFFLIFAHKVKLCVQGSLFQALDQWERSKKREREERGLGADPARSALPSSFFDCPH